MTIFPEFFSKICLQVIDPEHDYLFDSQSQRIDECPNESLIDMSKTYEMAPFENEMPYFIACTSFYSSNSTQLNI